MIPVWLKIVNDPYEKVGELKAALMRRRPRPLPPGMAVTRSRETGNDLFVEVLAPADHELAKETLTDWSIQFVEQDPPAGVADASEVTEGV